MRYWLLKSNPEVYSWQNLLSDGQSCWDGIRNHQAKNYLLAMKKAEFCLFYHSSGEKHITGLVRVIREAYPDPTSTEAPWVAVDIAVERAFKNPVLLSTIQSEPQLAGMVLLRQPRLSVSPVTASEFVILCSLGGIVL